MNCSEVLELLSAYADGEVAAAEKVEVHLAGCDACRKRLEAIETLQGKLRRSMADPMRSPDLTASVIAQLPGQRIERPRRWVWATVAAFLILAGAFRLAFWQAQPTMPQIVARPPKLAAPLPGEGLTNMRPRVVRAPGKPTPELSVSGTRFPKHREPRRFAQQRPQRRPPGKEPSASLRLASLPAIKIDVHEVPLSQAGRGIRKEMTATFVIGSVTVSRGTLRVSDPPPVDPEAANIERPPLPPTVIEST